MSFNLVDVVREKLADGPLQEALAKALGTVRTKSAAALAELADADRVAQDAGKLRQESVSRMRPHLESFTDKLEAAGTQVLWARDAREVKQHVARIASEHRVLRAVLSKTMVGEEVGLEQSLKDAGVSVIQSDLGERVVQLARQKPSHITAPCLHLRAGDVGRILNEKAGLPYSDDPETISRTLGKALRKSFFEAQMGVTGANFLVAEDGSLVSVENEGNVRMGYSLPDVHVVVTAIDKVVGTRREAGLLLDLLARKATGQRSTCYVNWLPPAPLPGQIRYVILVDNGRTELFQAGPQRELLRCIRCGACMNVCPVYERVGGHAYGWTYPGPIGIAMAPWLAPPEVGAEVTSLCSLCGACTEVCPVRIPLDRLIIQARGKASTLQPANRRKERRAFGWVRSALGGAWRYRLSQWGHKQALARAPERLAALQEQLGWGEQRRAPKPATTLFRDWHGKHRGGGE